MTHSNQRKKLDINIECNTSLETYILQYSYSTAIKALLTDSGETDVTCLCKLE